MHSLCEAADVIILLNKDRLDFQSDLLSQVFNDVVVDTISYVSHFGLRQYYVTAHESYDPHCIP